MQTDITVYVRSELSRERPLLADWWLSRTLHSIRSGLHKERKNTFVPFLAWLPFWLIYSRHHHAKLMPPHAMAINPVMRWQDWFGNSGVDLLNGESVPACVAADEP